MIVPGQSAVVSVDEATRVGEARRLAASMAERLGFGGGTRSDLAIVVTEAATNLLKHATGGRLVLRPIDELGAAGVEVLALDRGPGMADVGRCLADGFSTAGSPGNGLGAIRRLSTGFDIHSSPSGTAMLARLVEGPPAARGTHPRSGLGVVNQALDGEEVSGDAWAVEEREGRTLIAVADGLGHGLPASEAAREAVRTFRDRAADGPGAVLAAAHDALRKTRGAAMAVAEIDHLRGRLCYAGVGNISGSIVAGPECRGTGLVSHNGTVGHAVRKIQEFAHPWPAGALLVMHSDGLGTQWRLGAYAGLASRSPSLIAGVLYRDFRRERDDVTVLAAREGEAPA
ncbi:Serine/threonine-protein kinase RsbT [Aquisphaera giovannonii]|uniref:Serine/threonine-protein kinase RsbT n=1 Tax=Aquisphaera giovannonii TaxID=406548 RepID=A0A5B9W1Q2_9BACT|nr:ATP-binding SpoIIE family protein phosphatase [Aquisphaera giovannonii]QEH34526.1 Serine/threonine-protein kinase RsbT [Aquisphaera giovannonii]